MLAAAQTARPLLYIYIYIICIHVCKKLLAKPGLANAPTASQVKTCRQVKKTCLGRGAPSVSSASCMILWRLQLKRGLFSYFWKQFLHFLRNCIWFSIDFNWFSLYIIKLIKINGTIYTKYVFTISGRGILLHKDFFSKKMIPKFFIFLRNVIRKRKPTRTDTSLYHLHATLCLIFGVNNLLKCLRLSVHWVYVMFKIVIN